MKVSVVLPNYNGQRFLKESMESVLNQTFSDLELIVVDDGSTDDSRSIIESFADKRIKKIYLRENLGICRALNIGLQSVEGEYIARMDCDDVWDLNKLEKQVIYMDMIKTMDLCFTFARLIDEDGYNGSIRYNLVDELYHTTIDSQKELFERLVFQGNCLNHPSVLIRKSSFEEVGMFYRVTSGKLQDLELWIRFLIHGKNIGMLEEELISYRWLPHLGINDSFPSKKYIQQAYNEHISIMQKAFLEISDEVYINWYGNSFIQAQAKDELSLLVEKAFYLMKTKTEYDTMPIVISFFEKVLDTKEGEDILFNRYNFNMKDFYRLLQNPVYFDSMTLHEIKEKEEEIEQLNWRVEYTKASYENTNSWKLTKPFRDIKKAMK